VRLSYSWRRLGSPARVEQFSLEQTYLVKRFIAEHAYRWIVAQRPVQHPTWFRPRVVDLTQYKAEEACWSLLHGDSIQR
jgi:hypothetical protein